MSNTRSWAARRPFAACRRCAARSTSGVEAEFRRPSASIRSRRVAEHGRARCDQSRRRDLAPLPQAVSRVVSEAPDSLTHARITVRTRPRSRAATPPIRPGAVRRREVQPQGSSAASSAPARRTTAGPLRRQLILPELRIRLRSTPPASSVSHFAPTKAPSRATPGGALTAALGRPSRTALAAAYFAWRVCRRFGGEEKRMKATGGSRVSSPGGGRLRLRLSTVSRRSPVAIRSRRSSTTPVVDDPSQGRSALSQTAVREGRLSPRRRTPRSRSPSSSALAARGRPGRSIADKCAHHDETRWRAAGCHFPVPPP